MIQDYAQELITTAKEMKELAFEYKKSRAEYADSLNKLIILIEQAGLSKDKSSFENKLPKLLSLNVYNEIAKVYIEKLYSARANYKGLEEVLKAYQAHISGIQSVIKYNLSGEIANAMSLKYGGGESEK